MLEDGELKRYGRQILLKEFGVEGQEKLKASKVLVIGAGGLGSPVLQYLAGAGIGTIGIADADEVDITNIHRQVMHKESNVGVKKTESAKERVLEINSLVKVITYPYFITEDNIGEIVRQYDFVIDAVDNFKGKFLINDACVANKIPFCHAGVIRFEGQVMTYVPGKGACYRCFFGEEPEDGVVPSSSEVGVIGPIVGAVGSVQALEAIKYLTGIGELLIGRMYIIDGLNMKARVIKLPKAVDTCKACGGKN